MATRRTGSVVVCEQSEVCAYGNAKGVRHSCVFVCSTTGTWQECVSLCP